MKYESSDTTIISDDRQNNNIASKHQDLTAPKKSDKYINVISRLGEYKIIQHIDGVKPHPLGDVPCVKKEQICLPDETKLNLKLNYGSVKFKKEITRELDRLRRIVGKLELGAKDFSKLLGVDYDILSDGEIEYGIDTAKFKDKSESRVAFQEGRPVASKEKIADFQENSHPQIFSSVVEKGINDVFLLEKYSDSLTERLTSAVDLSDIEDSNIAAKEQRGWDTAKLLIFDNAYGEFYLYSVSKGMYEIVDESVIYSDILEFVTTTLVERYIDYASKMEVGIPIGKGKNKETKMVKPFEWLSDLEKYEQIRIGKKCYWMLDNASKLAKATLDLLKKKTQFVLGKPLLGKSSRYINVENGVVDVLNKRLLPHNPSYEFTYVLPGKYLGDEESILPTTFLEYANGAIKNAKERIPFLRACIYNGMLGKLSTKYQVFLEFTGVANSGKGTMQLIIDLLVGEGNYLACNMAALSDKWTVFNSKGKLHIHIDDAPKLVKTRDILSFSSGASMKGEAKQIQKVKNLNFGGIITISSNNLTSLVGASLEEYERRRQPFYFKKNEEFIDREFLRREDNEWTGEIAQELDELITWVINQDDKQADLLIKQTKKTGSEGDVDGLLSTYPILRFMNDCLVYQEGEFTPCSMMSIPGEDRVLNDLPIDLYTSYKRWCNHNGQVAVNSENFAKETKSLIKQKVLSGLDIKWTRWKKAPFRDSRGIANVTLRNDNSSSHAELPCLLNDLLLEDED